MDVHILGWLGLGALVAILLVVDFVGHVKNPHEPTIKEAAIWSGAYIALAALFGVVIWWLYGGIYGGQYYAGWLTEWSLSLDNLFVFVIILAAFRVPRKYQQKVLLAGIVIALVLRLVFILLGSAIVNNFSWIFYIFGAFLIWVAISQAREGVTKKDEGEYEENVVTRWTRKVFPTTDGFIGAKLLHRHAGKTYITPMLIVIVAIGSADVMFAIDSIPTIFVLTKEPYIVFAANAFSLLGLRQLFFLIDGLLERLLFLHYGLAAILGLIGIKAVMHAMEENTLWFINGGQPIHNLPEPGVGFSLGYILLVLFITTITSVLYSAQQKRKEISLTDSAEA